MIKVNTQTLTTSREAIPANLKGLSSHTLNNLQTELNPVPLDLLNIEYWPENRLVQSIAATDWVVLRAKELGQPVPLDVYTYRGDLRQLPEQAGFPATITWPEEI